jgi:alkanesulfonate monooxygenase SsuD/methylene tetrahydromethanopterin reductase-like flavin-dependent oxidoreductase (luciferase family)
MLLGLGIGLCRQELAAVRPKEANAPRGEVLDELIASLRLLLAHQGKSVSFSGKHLQFGEIALDPKPVQNPMPIYVPGKVVEALERIARFGLGMMVQGTVAQARVEALKPLLEKHGRGLDEIDVVIEGQIRLASTREKAIADYHASRQGQFSLKRGAQPDKLIADNWIGTPAEVIDKIMTVARKGFSHFCVLHISGDSFQERIEQMEIFAKEVMPNLK